MSIDYSDMAFPKPGKKKKRKIHKKSILNSQKGICYLCARLNGDYSVKQTEEHHILFGAGQRAISEENGLKVDLCIEHHRTGSRQYTTAEKQGSCSVKSHKQSLKRFTPEKNGNRSQGRTTSSTTISVSRSKAKAC